MRKTFTVAIIGCGNRGSEAYGQVMLSLPELYKIVAVCDTNAVRLSNAATELFIPNDALFDTEESFFEKKRADILVIATQDADHVRQCIKALSLGYDILLEKPITKSREECEALLSAKEKYGGKVIVCHVLRYAPAYVRAAEILDSGKLGRLVAVNALERVGYWHQAHSFVRGNWRREDETSPMVIAKTCHDLDYIQYFAKSKCSTVSSIGDLIFFRRESAPPQASERCVECGYIDTCPYSAKTIYLGRWKSGHDWPTNVVTLTRPITEEAIMKDITSGPYGRCVFACDNDVVDHQITNMTFENGVKATLVMTGFTGGRGRRICFHCTYGELVIDEDENYIKIDAFGKDAETIEISDLTLSLKSATGAAHGGHGGGDVGLIRKMYEVFSGDADEATTLEASVESHLMGIAAEESRLLGGALVRVHK